jgi:hypothetical protein
MYYKDWAEYKTINRRSVSFFKYFCEIFPSLKKTENPMSPKKLGYKLLINKYFFNKTFPIFDERDYKHNSDNQASGFSRIVEN